MRLRLALLGLAMLAACSPPSAGGSASQNGAAPAASATATAGPAPGGTACDRKLVTVDDMKGILTGPVTMAPLAGDPQSCVFKTADTSVIVSLRPGQGDLTVKTVLSGGENVDATPLPGVGDKAAWTAILHEVNATKNNVLCDINPAGAASATQQALGALCNKIFAGL